MHGRKAIYESGLIYGTNCDKYLHQTLKHLKLNTGKQADWLGLQWNREELSHQEPNRPPPWPWTSLPQNSEEINFSCVSPHLWILLWLPEQVREVPTKQGSLAPRWQECWSWHPANGLILKSLWRSSRERATRVTAWCVGEWLTHLGFFYMNHYVLQHFT